jgi:CheY-like chemotaxis protein
LVKGLVALHGGTVQAASAGLGKGSEFTIQLPRSVIVEPEAVAPSIAEVVSVTHGLRGKIVVADDNRDAADSLKMLLEFAGHDVFVAYNGQQALDLGAREHPQVFVLDVGMPDITGYEVARRIRQQAWGRGVLLLAVTGWGQDDDKEKAKAAGFDFHFTKPVNPEQVEERVAAFLHTPRPVTSHAVGDYPRP